MGRASARGGGGGGLCVAATADGTCLHEGVLPYAHPGLYYYDLKWYYHPHHPKPLG